MPAPRQHSNGGRCTLPLRYRPSDRSGNALPCASRTFLAISFSTTTFSKWSHRPLAWSDTYLRLALPAR
jgi:hypothetical protein